MHFFYKTALDGCFWVISNMFFSSSIFNNIYKKMWEIDKKDMLQELQTKCRKSFNIKNKLFIF